MYRKEKTTGVKSASMTAKAKKSAKTNKKALTVNLVNVNSVAEVLAKFAESKLKASMKINKDEALALIEKYSYCPVIAVKFDECNCNAKCQKKPNVFKRVWNWLLGRK